MPPHTAGGRPDVSIIIPVFNKLDLTRVCVESIHREAADATWEILVVDNGSSDGTAAWLADQQRQGRLRAVANPDNLGFSRGCNVGAAAARGRYLLFLNNDMEVLSGWLDPMVTTLDHDPDVGVVGARLLFPDGTIQHAGVAMVRYTEVDPPLVGGQHKSYKEPGDDPDVCQPLVMQVVTGACLMIRPEVFTAAGGFDEGYWNGNEDVDLCLKAGLAGWQVVYRPESTVIHYESQSGPERWAQLQANLDRFNAAWRDRLVPDFSDDESDACVATPGNLIRPYAAPRLRFSGRRGTWPAQPLATVIVSADGNPGQRRHAAEALVRHTDGRHRLLLIDDGADRSVSLWLRELVHDRPATAIVRGGGLAAVNAALARARGEAVCVLDGAAVVAAGWLDALLACLGADVRVGLAGPLTNVPAGVQTVTPGYDTTSLAGLESFAADLAARGAGRVEQTAWLGGGCLLLRAALIEKVGGFDPAFRTRDRAFTDLCLRALLAGFRSVAVHDAFVHAPADDAPQGHRQADRARLNVKWSLDRADDSLLKDLLRRGFTPPLHFEPLATGPCLEPVPVADWEIERWIDAGEASYGSGRPDEAARIFRAVLDARPDHPRAANDLAVTVLQLDPGHRGRTAARAILARILALDPDNADAAWNLQELESAAAPVS